ncbi:MAG: CHRD domain-containing protein [Sporichthyaceae bacterium]
MRRRVVGAAVGCTAIAGGLVLSSLVGVAQAGHTNKVITATLTGAKEVGKKGDPNGKGTITIFGIDNDTKTLCYVLKVNGIQLAAEGMAGHIHKGGKNANGPVVTLLAAPGDGDAADCLTNGEKNPKGAKVFLEGTKAADILKNPSRYYVNVHNPEFPDGALRGQLKFD